MHRCHGHELTLPLFPMKLEKRKRAERFNITPWQEHRHHTAGNGLEETSAISSAASEIGQDAHRTQKIKQAAIR